MTIKTTQTRSAAKGQMDETEESLKVVIRGQDDMRKQVSTLSTSHRAMEKEISELRVSLTEMPESLENKLGSAVDSTFHKFRMDAATDMTQSINVVKTHQEELRNNLVDSIKDELREMQIMTITKHELKVGLTNLGEDLEAAHTHRHEELCSATRSLSSKIDDGVIVTHGNKRVRLSVEPGADDEDGPVRDTDQPSPLQRDEQSREGSPDSRTDTHPLAEADALHLLTGSGLR